MTTSHIDILRKHCGKYRMVKVQRTVSDSREVSGFVIDISDTLVMLSQFNDFDADGCNVLRLADIERVRSGPKERAFERIFAAEGLLDAVGLSSPPPITDMETLLRDLARRRANAVLQIEDADVDPGSSEEEDSFESMESAFEETLAELREGRRSGLTFEQWLADGDDEDGTSPEFVESFLIGRVAKVEDGECWVHNFDAEGNWDVEPTAMPLSRITSVELQTPYLETWLRHLAPFPGDVQRPSS